MSSSVPSPAVMRSRISSMRCVPTRHGTHLPQHSSAVNVRKNLAKSTMQVVSSIDDHAARAHHGAGGERLSKSIGLSSSSAGQTAARWAAELHGLEVAPGQHAAADVEDDLAQGGAHRHFDEAGVTTLPVSEKILVPFEVAVPMAREGLAPWPMIHGTLA